MRNVYNEIIIQFINYIRMAHFLKNFENSAFFKVCLISVSVWIKRNEITLYIKFVLKSIARLTIRTTQNE